MGMNQGVRTSGRLVAFAVLAACLTLTACQRSLNGLEDGAVLIGGVAYRVTSLVVAESFPVQIGVTVEIENVSNTSQTRIFPDGCVVLMRAYSGGVDPVWDMASAVGCTMALVEVTLAPGEVQEFQTGLVSAATILDGGLPNGEYRITAYLRPGEIVEIEAGNVDLAVP